MATTVMPPARNNLADSRTIEAGGYAVRVGVGLRHQFAALITEVAPAHHFAVICDSNVSAPYGAALLQALSQRGGGRASLHQVPSGESNKSRESWIRLTDELLAAGCGRDTTIVALGGGVVGDLAGFVAATYMRGVPLVHCPTSLLGMIDASIGGKTGVDTAAGKNLVGAFHAPAAVFADVEMVSTLPLPHRRGGLAEAVKHGVIADADYFERISQSADSLLSAEPEILVEIVSRSVAIKVEVVSIDAREAGRRKTLNFGHTIGHAIEHASGYELAHGECVSIGMVLEARIAERLGIAERNTAQRIESLIRRLGLPSAPPASVSADAIFAATRMDKKMRAGQLEFALPSRIGAMAGEGTSWAIAASDALVREILR